MKTSYLSLSDFLCHRAAPQDWLERYGVGFTDHRLLCPMCGTEEVRISTDGTWNDSYLIAFPEGPGSVLVRTRDGEAKGDDPQNRGLYVCIPMECDSGHGWLLDIGHPVMPNDCKPPYEPFCSIAVHLDEPLYWKDGDELEGPIPLPRTPAPPDPERERLRAENEQLNSYIRNCFDLATDHVASMVGAPVGMEPQFKEAEQLADALFAALSPPAEPGTTEAPDGR